MDTAMQLWLTLEEEIRKATNAVSETLKQKNSDLRVHSISVSPSKFVPKARLMHVPKLSTPLP